MATPQKHRQMCSFVTEMILFLIGKNSGVTIWIMISGIRHHVNQILNHQTVFCVFTSSNVLWTEERVTSYSWWSIFTGNRHTTNLNAPANEQKLFWKYNIFPKMLLHYSHANASKLFLSSRKQYYFPNKYIA